MPAISQSAVVSIELTSDEAFDLAAELKARAKEREQLATTLTAAGSRDSAAVMQATAARLDMLADKLYEPFLTAEEIAELT